MQRVPEIETDRLILKAATKAILTSELAFLRGEGPGDDFADAIGAAILIWPPLYHDDLSCAWGIEKLTANPDQLGWGQWHILLKRADARPILVASAGFHGPPDAEGNTEIGYSVIESHQRQGIAPEIVAALAKWAFQHAAVNKLTITTLDTPELAPSSKVAQRSGFRLVGTRGSGEGTLLVYELTRQEYVSKHLGKSGA